MFKSILTVLVVVMVWSLGTSSAFAVITNATLTDDTWGEPNNSQTHGGSTLLALQDQGNVVAWQFFKFDLSAIGAGQVVTAATLTVELRNDWNNVGGVFEVREMQDGTWTENDLTGAIGQPLIGNALGSGSIANPVSAGPIWEIFNFDVASYVQGSAGDFVVSFAVTTEDIVGQSGSGILRAVGRSKEHATESFRKARLVVTHDIPEPATLALLGLGSLAMLRRRHVRSA